MSQVSHPRVGTLETPGTVRPRVPTRWTPLLSHPRVGTVGTFRPSLRTPRRPLSRLGVDRRESPANEGDLASTRPSRHLLPRAAPGCSPGSGGSAGTTRPHSPHSGLVSPSRSQVVPGTCAGSSTSSPSRLRLPHGPSPEGQGAALPDRRHRDSSLPGRSITCMGDTRAHDRRICRAQMTPSAPAPSPHDLRTAPPPGVDARRFTCRPRPSASAPLKALQVLEQRVLVALRQPLERKAVPTTPPSHRSRIIHFRN
jgi:hypothetical protein